MDILNSYPHRSQQSASRIVDGEAVIVMPLESSINTLNEVGTRVWELTDGSRSVRDIIDKIWEEFETDQNELSEDITSFLIELQEKKIIELKTY